MGTSYTKFDFPVPHNFIVNVSKIVSGYGKITARLVTRLGGNSRRMCRTPE